MNRIAMTRLISLLLLALSAPAGALILRHDVDDARYQVPVTEFRALVDLPHEAHGVLIAPQWVVTAAHATQWHEHPIEAVTLNGTSRKVERVVVHPGFKPLPAELLSGDAAPAMRWQAASDDIALIKLAEPVTDVTPVAIHRAGDEMGKLVKLLGKGATGNGRDGQDPHSPHRTQLRRAFNLVTVADTRWLGYRFDAPGAAHPLEGMVGSGDSGGPMLLEVDGEWHLAGLASWTYYEGDVAAYRAGVYGLSSRYLRISRYAAWIDDVLTSDKAAVAAPR